MFFFYLRNSGNVTVIQQVKEESIKTSGGNDSKCQVGDARRVSLSIADNLGFTCGQMYVPNQIEIYLVINCMFFRPYVNPRLTDFHLFNSARPPVVVTPIHS